MLQMFVMRHVEADAIKGPGGDFARKITSQGRSVAETAMDHLGEIDYAPDAIIASSAERTQQTSEIVCRNLAASVSLDRRLYLATQEELVRFLGDIDEQWQSLFLIGHNNGISDLVTYLTRAPCSLHTGSIAKLNSQADSFSQGIASGTWQLEECWHPAHFGSS